MNARQHAAVIRNVDRQRAERKAERVRQGRCPRCGERAYPVGPYMICRALRCNQLVVT